MKNSVQWVISAAIVFIFIMASCGHSTNPQKGKTKSKESSSVKVKPEKKNKQKKAKIFPLSDGNVVEELTRYGKENAETLVWLKTPKGNMKIKLYENTPLHRANIIRLIKNNFYKGTLFYRVVNEFMIQGGDSDDWERASIKGKMGSYTIPAELRSENIHKKGAMAMARDYDDNPEKRSTPFEFFIVQGTQYTPGEIKGAEQTYDLHISANHSLIYQNQGGCPHLDGQHTVFGQVIEGLDVIDKIAAVEVDEGDWPIEDMTIDFEIIE